MLGEMIAEFKGKVTAIKVLSEGKTEVSEQETGSILGNEATWLATSLSSPASNGVSKSEGEAIVTTANGDVVLIKKSGIGWSKGMGRKASRRGVFFHSTQSQTLARLNRVVGVWEFESEENGDWQVRVWEWK